MPNLTLDFTWYRDPKGYRLIAAKASKLRPGQSWPDGRPSDVQPARIVRNGGELQSYRPRLDDGVFSATLLDRFLAVKAEDDVLGFVETFGPLTHEGLRRKGDVVPAVIDEAQEMAAVLNGRISGVPLKFNAHIITDTDGLRLKVWPASLLDALWLLIAQSGRDRFRQCSQCRISFIIGSGHRRADARFCSDECRIKFNSLKRSRA